MKIAFLNELIANKKEDEDVLVFFWDKDETEEHVINNFDLDTEDFELSKEEWQYVIEKMNDADDLWQSIHEGMDYYLRRVLDNRKVEKGKQLWT